MNVMTNAKTKLSQISGKVLDSKAYKTAERIAVGAGAAIANFSNRHKPLLTNLFLKTL